MRKTIAVATMLAIGLAIPQTGHAIPAFTRKHGFNCNMCHTSYTKLNDFGQRFRDDGYQIPGQEGAEKSVFETPPPIAFRTSFGLLAAHTKQADTYGFDIVGFDLLAAGMMHKNISFLFIYTPRIDEPAADHTGTSGGTNPSQLATLESANLVFSDLIQDRLNLRVGRFEPAYHLVSSKRSYYLQQSYEVYGFGTPGNSFAFEDNQMGLEVAGRFPQGFGYALGVVNGNGANPDNNKRKDFYLTLHKVFGRGDGQSAGQQIGVFGYLGWQPSITQSLSTAIVQGAAPGAGNKPFRRLGGNVSLNWRTFNLRALFMQGVDDKALNSSISPGAQEDYEFTGGFAQLDYAGLWNNRLLASVMYNWVEPPCGDDGNAITAMSGLVRYYLGSWTAVNVALHAEYTHREVGENNPQKEDLLALLIDFAF